jgi:hypothetical protein
MPDEVEFTDEFDFDVARSIEPGNGAYFGRNVLGGLTGGIEEFVAGKEARWRSRRGAPTLLGCAMWIDDPEVLDALATLSAVCVVISKQTRAARQLQKLQPLAAFNETGAGIPQRAFPTLYDLSPREGGEPRVVGPYDEMGEAKIPAIRSLGFRRRDGRLVPILHAKLALLGEIWHYDEGPAGQIGDFFAFTASRLWVSSANFTARSRTSLEVGFWTEDRELVQAAERFVLSAIRFSGPLDAEADDPDPEFVPVQFDDAAMLDALVEMRFESTDS